MWLWFNGTLIEQAEFRLGGGLAFANMVYEGLRCYATAKGPALFRPVDHIKRLFNSAHKSNLRIDYTLEEILSGIKVLLNKKRLSQAYVRLEAFTLKAGDPSASLLINAEDRASFYQERLGYKDRSVEREGIELMICYLNRRSSNQRESVNIKGSKGIPAFSWGELARRQGYATALLLYDNDLVGEAAEANIFWIKEGVLHTPPTHAPILPGITRDSVLQLAQSSGLHCQETSLKVELLPYMDEIFLTGTAVGIVPVVGIEGKRIGQGRPGPLTRIIQDLYQRCCRGDLPPFQSWLYYLSV